MKRLFFILLAGVIGINIIFYFRPKSPTMSGLALTPPLTNVTTVIEPNYNSTLKTQATNTEPLKPMSAKRTVLNVIGANAQNIKEWKTAIPNLHNDPINKKNWVMWQSFTNTGLPFIVGNPDNTSVEFDSNFININTKKDSDDIRRIEMQSVWMNITDIRSLGDSLLQVMNSNDTSFNAWCDKVGNSWIDKPEFTSAVSPLPNSNKVYGFQVRSTFNDKKPWYILLIITDR